MGRIQRGARSTEQRREQLVHVPRDTGDAVVRARARRGRLLRPGRAAGRRPLAAVPEVPPDARQRRALPDARRCHGRRGARRVGARVLDELEAAAAVARRGQGRTAGAADQRYLAAPQAMVVADHTTQHVAAKPYTVATTAGRRPPTSPRCRSAGTHDSPTALRTGRPSTRPSSADTYLCTKADGECSCPDDTDSAGNDLPASIQKVKGFLRLGLTGASDGAKGTLTGLSLKDFCKKRNHKKATTACEVLTVRPSTRSPASTSRA